MKVEVLFRSAAVALAASSCLALGACDRHSGQAAAQARTDAVAVARGVIAVDGGLVSVAAPRDGLVAKINVDEGDHVARGQVLALLDGDRAKLEASQAAAETAQAEAAWRGAQAKVTAASAEAARLRRLADADAATKRDAAQAQQAATIASAAGDEARRAVDVARARQRLAELEQSARVVRSPVSGVVLRRSATLGATAGPSAAAPMFVIAPDAPRIIRAELDEAFVGRVAPGATAWVTDASGEGASYKARVLRVSPAFESASLDDQPGARADSRVLRMVLAFDQPNGLRLGQRVLARIGQ
jgi:multidrug resistance efflux pump